MTKQKPKGRRYARVCRRWPSLLLAVLTGVGLWLLAPQVYTAARRTQLTAQPTEVEAAAAREIVTDTQTQEAYHLQSAAELRDRRGRVRGYTVITARTGYKSSIRVQSTFSAGELRLASIRVLSQNETEYLGERVSSAAFTSSFAGRQPPLKLWGSAAEGSPIDGLTGSTISAQAVVAAVNDAYAFLKAYQNGAA